MDNVQVYQGEHLSADPLISVVLDTYNHGPLLTQAIESVLIQKVAEGEIQIIVVDDGSTDAASRYADLSAQYPKITFILKQNGGQASAFNIAVPYIRGKYVAFLDGDDVWKEGKLQRIVSCFLTFPDVGFVGHAIEEFYLDGGSRIIRPSSDFEFQIGVDDGLAQFMSSRCFMGTSRMALRTELLKQLLPMPEQIKIEADEYIFTLAPLLSKARILAEPLTRYRIHDGNFYMIGLGDARKVKFKLNSIEALAVALREELAKRGLAKDSTEIIVESIEHMVAKLRCALPESRRRDVLKVEMRMLKREHSPMKILFRLAVMLLGVLLPPSLFLKFRRGYSLKVLGANKALEIVK